MNVMPASFAPAATVRMAIMREYDSAMADTRSTVRVGGLDMLRCILDI